MSLMLFVLCNNKAGIFQLLIGRKKSRGMLKMQQVRFNAGMHHGLLLWKCCFQICKYCSAACMYFTAKIRTFECGMALAGTVCTIPMHRRKRVMTISEVAKTPVAASALS